MLPDLQFVKCVGIYFIVRGFANLLFEFKERLSAREMSIDDVVKE